MNCMNILNLFFLILFIISVAVMLVFIVRYHREAALRREIQACLRRLETDREASYDIAKSTGYMALQNQINPHFLYNTLDAIRGDALKAGAEQVADLIEYLSSFFSYTISNMEHYATVYEELEHVREYYYIQKYRFKDRLELTIDNLEEVDIRGIYVPRLILQPLVENAISHGLEIRKKQGSVRISLSETENDIEIHVADDGIGMDSESLLRLNEKLNTSVPEHTEGLKKRGGIALANVNSRIKMLCGREYGLHIYSAKDVGTDVVVRLPKTDGEKVNEIRIS